MVIDDNRDSADSLALLLGLNGHLTQVAYDGHSGVEQAEQWRPEVVVLDIGMPDINGYEVCRQIRQRPWGRTAVVIAQTGWGQQSDRQRAKDEGFDAHVVKPVDLATLTRLIETLVPSSRHDPA
jgi:CheY-like chemotaxis protein